MALERELATFDAKKDKLLKYHRGKYALIHGNDVLGVYDRAENAYLEGLKTYERGKFLVQLISPDDSGYRVKVQSPQG